MNQQVTTPMTIHIYKIQWNNRYQTDEYYYRNVIQHAEIRKKTKLQYRTTSKSKKTAEGKTGP